MSVEPFPFATVAELTTRWPELASLSEARAKALLEEASQFILDVAPLAGRATPATRRRIAMRLVKDAVNAERSDLSGVESIQQGAGSYQATLKPFNPTGDFYLTKWDKRALGLGRQTAFSIDLTGGRL